MVVVGGSDPAEGAGAGLSLDRIVRVAIAVADAEGIDALTMRRVSADLGAGAMSLYRYVSDKQDLVGNMVDTVFGELPYPDVPPTGWRSRLEWAGRSEWEMCRRHPWILPVMATQRPVVRPQVMAYVEWVLAGVDHLGLDGDTMLQIFLLISDYAQGAARFAVDERSESRRTGISSAQWWEQRIPEFRTMLETGGYPVWSRLLARGEGSAEVGKNFEFGLQRILDGLEEYLDGREAASARGSARELLKVTSSPVFPTGGVSGALARATEVLGRRWVLEIVYVLSRGDARFGDLVSSIPGVSRRLLTERLRQLDDAGLVCRESHPGPPTRITYALTERGRGLRPALDAIDTWARQFPAEAPPNESG